LINHSPEFTRAIVASFVEYFVEWLFFPGLKGTWIMWLGMAITAAGQTLRTIAQFHARHNFTHKVQEAKREEHALVTDGPYQYIRHPGYLGWFWWAVGTQVLLFNPICIFGYAYAAWRFFKLRIEHEEAALSSPTMFGDKYKEYRAKTPTYLPLID
jgi:protein-S-isoprenylcysteine O-methyltransferase